jgi:hypothetical protein
MSSEKTNTSNKYIEAILMSKEFVDENEKRDKNRG